MVAIVLGNEESLLMKAQGGEVGEYFVQTKHNQESNMSNVVLEPSLHGEYALLKLSKHYSSIRG